MIPVGRLAPGNQWDQNMLDRLFANELYPTGLTFKTTAGYPVGDGCVLIIPGRYWAGHTGKITEAIRLYRWVLAIRTSDEEDLFDIRQVEHPNIRWWIQTPRMDREYDARLIGLGYPPHFNVMERDAPGKQWADVFLSAQKTHQRRVEAFAATKAIVGPLVFARATEGFTEGMSKEEYAGSMSGAKVAPAPSGAVSPDSFRLYEALEAHCVPIADDVSPAYDSQGYWRRMFPDAPFPILTDYRDLEGLVTEALGDWPRNANRITAWWMQQKRKLSLWLREDLEALGAL